MKLVAVDLAPRTIGAPVGRDTVAALREVLDRVEVACGVLLVAAWPDAGDRDRLIAQLKEHVEAA
jgi:hypothetical protein